MGATSTLSDPAAPAADGPPDELLAPWVLRSRFAVALSTLYSREVPAYDQLVRTCEVINREVAERVGAEAVADDATLRRITTERHGAIRVGSPGELAKVARLFAQLGMDPVGFYDLRDTAGSSLPIVSTAFRPTDPTDLARSAFRVFTSMLVTDDPRFFDPDTRQAVEVRVAGRDLLAPGLTEMLHRAEGEGGIRRRDADGFIRSAVATFALDRRPIDLAWHEHLMGISPVAADIAASHGTHINHLTPRVLDIEELYSRMSAQGVQMIDRIQGPPRWAGPDVLLRQTSFRALDEDRAVRRPDGTIEQRPLRVRFGEVEARGIALTPAGRDRYDRVTASDIGTPGGADLLKARFATTFPSTAVEFALQGLAYAEYLAVPGPLSGIASVPTLRELVHAGFLTVHPITYEDFLPRSAAGIFRSNLVADGARRRDAGRTHWDAAALGAVMGRPVLDPFVLANAQQQGSLQDACDVLGVRVPTS